MDKHSRRVSGGPAGRVTGENVGKTIGEHVGEALMNMFAKSLKSFPSE